MAAVPSRVSVFASAARTATPTAVTLSTKGCRGLVLVTKSTAASATPSVVVTISGKDVTTGGTYTILAGAAITDGATTQTLKVYPGITAAANASVSDALPEQIVISPAHGDADSITYSIGCYLIP